MVQYIPNTSIWDEIGEAAGKGLATGYTNRSDEKALQKSIMAAGEKPTPRQILDAVTNTRTYSPESKQTFLKNAMGVAEFEQSQQKARDTAAAATAKNDIAIEKNQIAKAANEIKSGKDERTKLIKEQEDAETQKRVEAVRSQPGFEDLDEVGQFDALRAGKVPSAEAEKIAKLKASQVNREESAIDKSYEAQKDFISQVTDKAKAWETDTKPKLQLLSKLATDEELIGPTANHFREQLGIPIGALDNPNNEVFQKTSLDLLKGLPDTYGNRILKVEVDNFLKTIPSLENSVEGRRMIASNLLKLGEMKEVYYNEMRREQKRLLDNNEKFPKDFEQRVFDQVKPMIDRINNDFIKMTEIKHIPPETVPFFTPLGDIKFVPKQDVEWAKENGGRQVW